MCDWYEAAHIHKTQTDQIQFSNKEEDVTPV